GKKLSKIRLKKQNYLLIKRCHQSHRAYIIEVTRLGKPPHTQYSLTKLGRKNKKAKRYTKTRKDICEGITNNLIKSLEKGVLPWRQDWEGKSSNDIPSNAVTGSY